MATPHVAPQVARHPPQVTPHAVARPASGSVPRVGLVTDALHSTPRAHSIDADRASPHPPPTPPPTGFHGTPGNGKGERPFTVPVHLGGRNHACTRIRKRVRVCRSTEVRDDTCTRSCTGSDTQMGGCRQAARRNGDTGRGSVCVPTVGGSTPPVLMRGRDWAKGVWG